MQVYISNKEIEKIAEGLVQYHAESLRRNTSILMA